MSDLISRQAAIKALEDAGTTNYLATGDFYGIVNAMTVIKNMPTAEPEIIRCKDCKHRPYKSEDKQGFGVEFPDEICPCQCEDGWYNWRPDDDWFCADADMRGDKK